MIFLLALLLTGCSEKSGGSTQYQVYYISTSGTKLVEESYTPESSTSPREVTEELLEKMGRPQVGSDHVKALPDEVKVEHCVLKAREVDVWTSTRPTTIWTRFGRFWSGRPLSTR